MTVAPVQIDWSRTTRRFLLPPIYGVALGLAGWGLATLPPDVPPWWRLGLALLAALPGLIYASRIRNRWRALHTTAAWAFVPGWLWWCLLDPPTTARAWFLLLGALAAWVILLEVRWLINVDLGPKITIEGELLGWLEAAQRIGYPEANFVGHREIPGLGWTARLVWPAGAYDVDTVVRDAHKFEGARDLPRGSLKFRPRGRSRNSVDAIFIRDDPNTVAFEWEGPTGAHVADPYDLGKHADQVRSPRTVHRWDPKAGERRILLGGVSGSGKGSVIHTLVGEDAYRDDVVQLGFDMKGGVELSMWGRVFAWMVHDADGAMEMLAALEAAIRYRQGELRTLRTRLWPVQPGAARATRHRGRDQRTRRVAGRPVGETGPVHAGPPHPDLHPGPGPGHRAALCRAAAHHRGDRHHPALQPGGHPDRDADGRGGQRTLRIPRRRGAPERHPGGPAGHRVREGRRPVGPDPVPGVALAGSPDRAGGGRAGRLGRPARPGHRGRDGGGVADVRRALARHRPRRRGQRTGTPAADGGDDPAERVDRELAAPDVSLAAVLSCHGDRTGYVAPTPLRPRPAAKLGDDAARAAMRALLAQAGADGASARELYGAATRSSSWFHTVITEWIDEGSVERTERGRYASTGHVQ